MAALTIACLRAAGLAPEVSVGFGARGFLSEKAGVAPFLAIESPRLRRLLYPVWLAVAALRCLAAVARGTLIFVNAVYALPAALPALMLRPGRIFIHVHELEMPGLFRSLLLFARARGARVIAVSATHAAELGCATDVLMNAVDAGAPPPPPTRRSRLVFVGDNRPSKGFGLFVAIAEAGVPWSPRAVLGGCPKAHDPKLLARARAAGIELCFGLSDPAQMLADAALLLQLTDPAQVTETFSLTAAEAVWHLVPVGAAGSAAIAEVAGPALAFSLNTRDPGEFANAIRALASDQGRYAELVSGCEHVRSALARERYCQELLTLLTSNGPLPPKTCDLAVGSKGL
ncbi:glycosyltransferase [Thermaurantiacus tibetensis]|uniref:glycosyltransferase n=1 Tax=Thermaurantiacus tibetensis TaxID=2759035 RepID=UPI00188DD30B|nr:glycosyltransferase [Thermaurantiacus tibetensis]